MKIHLVTAEHFAVPGLIQKAFATHQDAVAEAIELVEIMLGDSSYVEWEAVTDATWESIVEKIQDAHGAAHCYVGVEAIDLIGAENGVVGKITEALEYQAEQFDGGPETDLSVSGADLVDWFSQWRIEAREELEKAGVA